MTNTDDPQVLQVVGALSSMTEAFRNADFEAFRHYLADDVTMYWPGDLTLTSGRAALEPKFAAVMATSRALAAEPPYLDWIPENVQVSMQGAAAIVTWRYHPGRTVNRRTFVFRQTTDGWKVTHIHADNLPLARRA